MYGGSMYPLRRYNDGGRWEKIDFTLAAERKEEDEILPRPLPNPACITQIQNIFIQFCIVSFLFQ